MDSESHKHSVTMNESIPLDHVRTQQHDDAAIGLEPVATVALESEYRISFKTYAVLFFMGLTWGTCTLANVGPSSTYSYAVLELGGSTLQSWIPNAALFPLIGLEPVWVGPASHTMIWL